MSNKHTQGAWKAEALADAYKVVAVERTPGLPIVTNVAMCTGPDAVANARLIASAPGLGEALDDLVREVILSDIPLPYIDSHFRHWIDKARAALVKAGVRQ